MLGLNRDTLLHRILRGILAAKSSKKGPHEVANLF